jgi:uncharacterized protein YndB with AHSA1/START domain
MTHEFEITEEIDLDATPEQVWAAIATGPGIDSWFMGHTEVEPREGGRNNMSLLGYDQQSTVTAWEPGKRFAFRGDTNPDGTFMAFEYLIEGRDGGSTVLRFVHNGLLGDDWESEYDALKEGDPMYLKKLATYVANFPDRTSHANLFLPGPEVPDGDHVWSAYQSLLGLTGPATKGAEVRVSVPGLPTADGVVAFVHLPTYVGVRTADGIHTLMHARGTVFIEYHGYTDDQDEKEIEAAWQSWLAATFA